MSFSDFFRKADEHPQFQAAERLATYDVREETDLPLHVRSCSQRYAMQVMLQKMQFDVSQSNRLWLLGIGAFLALTQSDKVIAFAEKFL